MGIFRPIQKASSAQVDEDAVRELLNDAGFAFKNQQFNVAKSTLALLLKKLPGLRSKNLALLNSLTSLQEGLSSQDFSQKEFMTSLREEFTAYRLAVESVLTELRDKPQDELTLDGLLSHQNNPLTSFEETRDTLERKLLDGSGVVVAHAPVIPLSTPPLDPLKLKQNGFKVESFAGYPIIHGMLVAGISTERVLAEVERARSGGKPSKDATPKPSTMQERQEVTDLFVGSVQAKYPNLKLIPVGGYHQWYEASWFLLLPQSHFKLLQKCTISPTPVQSLRFNKWSFPFSNRK
jgi:hypothetical protein